MDFDSFVTSRIIASLPFGASDVFPIVQGGITKNIPVLLVTGNWTLALALTASGTTPATALSLTSQFNEIVVTFGGAYAMLNQNQSFNLPIIITNYGGNDLLVLPPSGMQINNNGVNVAFTVVNGTTQFFFPAYASQKVYTIP